MPRVCRPILVLLALLSVGAIATLVPPAQATPPGVPTPAPPDNPYPPHNLPLKARVPLLGCDDCPSGARQERCTGWATLVSVDKVAEIVTLHVTGDISRWAVWSSPYDERYYFPEGFSFDGLVRIHSGVPEFESTLEDRQWTAFEIWQEEEFEIAELHACDGTPRGILYLP